MKVSKVFSAAIDGIEAKLIEIETDINVGLHSFNIVGLADKSLSEAKERVNSALKNIGVKPPNKENRRIVVNLAPADLKKTGSHYDLAIAIGYLLATKQIKDFSADNKIFVGELALDGVLRKVSGILNIARLAKAFGFAEIYLPSGNAVEAALVPGLKIIPADHLLDLIHHLEAKKVLSEQTATEVGGNLPFDQSVLEIADIKGQENAKRALMVAAAGGHNLLLQGSPGSGKTLLAQALVSILPPPEMEEILEITQIYSAANQLGSHSFINWRPFRAPHQTASAAAVIGGGQYPRPGEISLAHRGVLFLDELPEFRRDLLEALRQPLESGRVLISRARDNLTFPAKFILVAAMNPCPCGYYGDPEKDCRCSAHEVFRYQKKISGPLLDRIDLQVVVPRVKLESLQNSPSDQKQAKVFRQQVLQARQIQQERFQKAGLKIFTNSELNSKQCDELIKLESAADQFLKKIFERSLVSARGYYRTLKTARTIADLDGREQVSADNLAEAFQYRLAES